MKLSLLSSTLALCASLASAYPAAPSIFYLVTTSQSTPTSNSSELRAVSATTIFDPYYQSTLYLRLMGPGYVSAPNFTLTDGTLHTTAQGPHGIGIFEYNSTTVTAGNQLGFVAATQPAGNIALQGGYLVTVDGSAEGWSICEGDLEQDVVFWKGNASDCQPTYLHAVGTLPF